MKLTRKFTIYEQETEQWKKGREQCQTKSIILQKKRLESAEERRARLDKANERARAKRRMETEEPKNEARNMSFSLQDAQ